jgi:hypothetical protein
MAARRREFLQRLLHRRLDNPGTTAAFKITDHESHVGEVMVTHGLSPIAAAHFWVSRIREHAADGLYSVGDPQMDLHAVDFGVQRDGFAPAEQGNGNEQRREEEDWFHRGGARS